MSLLLHCSTYTRKYFHHLNLFFIKKYQERQEIFLIRARVSVPVNVYDNFTQLTFIAHCEIPCHAHKQPVCRHFDFKCQDTAEIRRFGTNDFSLWI